MHVTVTTTSFGARLVEKGLPAGANFSGDEGFSNPNVKTLSWMPASVLCGVSGTELALPACAVLMLRIVAIGRRTFSPSVLRHAHY
eukprot:711600-Rhodomonas_salina.1